jgi:rsbT co-antagonist protein RsbR
LALEDITSESLVHEQQQRLIRQLSAPVLPLQKQILVVPIIGPLNPERMRQVKEKLLESIRLHRTRIVILDLTGAAIENEEEEVVGGLSDITKASKLVGAIVILTGISSGIAQKLVNLGGDRPKLTGRAHLERGFDEANRILGYQRIANTDLHSLREELRQANLELDRLRKSSFQ